MDGHAQNGMPATQNYSKLNLLPNERLESFWDALWLELWPFLCFILESRIVDA